MSEMGNLEMIDIHLKADKPKLGWVRVWAVDEHGCVLHTEPICTVPVDFHSWFIDWIEGLEPPMKMPSLLHHPVE